MTTTRTLIATALAAAALVLAAPATSATADDTVIDPITGKQLVVEDVSMCDPATCGNQDPNAPREVPEDNCPPGTEFDPTIPVCVAMPIGETDGRAVDCPDGQIGFMHSGTVQCPGPVQAAPAPGSAAPAATGSPAADQAVDAPVTVDTTAAAAAAVGAPVVVAPQIDLAALMAWIRDLLVRFGICATL